MASNSKRKVKEPNAVKPYGIDWTELLESISPTDTLSTSVWVVEEGDMVLTLSNEAIVGAIAKVWVSGGTEGMTYRVRNRVVTAGGMTDDDSLYIRIRTR